VRILLVSDLHYTLPQLDWLVARAPQVDLLVMAGDHLDISSTVPLEAQSLVVLRYVEELGRSTTVVVSSGNHDLTGPDEHGEQTALWLPAARAWAAVDGDDLEVGGALVSVCPWWDGPVGRQRVEDQLSAAEAKVAARRAERGAEVPWIWVYHWPPAGSPTTWTGKTFYGDADLLGWIERFSPTAVLAGHVHQPPFKPEGAWADRVGTTWVFNAGRQIGAEPAHVVVDLGAGEATWTSLIGEEHQPLDQPPLERTSF
jgi:Icc-related predicted phosphoesterase